MVKLVAMKRFLPVAYLFLSIAALQFSWYHLSQVPRIRFPSDHEGRFDDEVAYKWWSITLLVCCSFFLAALLLVLIEFKHSAKRQIDSLLWGVTSGTGGKARLIESGTQKKLEKRAGAFWLVFVAAYLPGLFVLNYVDETLHLWLSRFHSDGLILTIAVYLSPLFALAAAHVKNSGKSYDSLGFALLFGIFAPVLTYLIFLAILQLVRGQETMLSFAEWRFGAPLLPGF